ncbi:MAG TPA: FAD-dependent monooxygenase, partial [Pyrinomonadaceae bacterium]|nr:FAD-dependent monooxygenase [Pyrinomonadaceae bacterium]
GRGHIVVMLDRADQWQCGYVMLKGSFGEVRAAGLDALKASIGDIAPDLKDRLGHLTSWKQFSMLSVESSRVRKWHRPGLLLIGDAAHVMSPVGGVGINYAIQDAVAAANVLAAPLLAGDVRDEHLREVQRRREWPTRVVQAVQRAVQSRVIAGVLDPDQPIRLPLLVRLVLRTPVLRDLPARFIAYGVRPARVES